MHPIKVADADRTAKQARVRGVGVMVSLLLPAVQAAREASRRMQCSNHLMQLTLALHNYQSAYKAFPAGRTALGLSAYAALLPFLEQSNVAAIAALGRANQRTDPPPTSWTMSWLGGVINAQQGHLDEAMGNFQAVLATKVLERGFDFGRDSTIINGLG